MAAAQAPGNSAIWEAVIIGGGLAGGACALALAKQGRKVLLIEKQEIAHHKVCGEFLSFEACGYLEALGLDLSALGAVPIRNTRLLCGNKTAVAALPFEGLSLSRLKLDEVLLEKARGAGVELLRGRTVTELHREGEVFKVVCDDGTSFSAAAVFLATGKHDLAEYKRPSGGAELIGFKMHYQAAGTVAETGGDTIDIILFPGGYAGLEPIEDGVLNFCLVVDRAFYAGCGKNWDALLGKITAATPGLQERLASPCWPKPLAVFPLPYGFLYRPGAADSRNLYRLGDQMAVIPSFSGDGMSIALHTAALAAASFQNADAAHYHRTARAQLEGQMRWAGGFARLLETPFSQRPLVGACRAWPGLIRFAASKTRLQAIV